MAQSSPEALPNSNSDKFNTISSNNMSFRISAASEDMMIELGLAIVEDMNGVKFSDTDREKNIQMLKAGINELTFNPVKVSIEEELKQDEVIIRPKHLFIRLGGAFVDQQEVQKQFSTAVTNVFQRLNNPQPIQKL